MEPRKPKASVEQVAWVLECLCENARAQQTLRSLIYTLMGFGEEAYEPPCRAGGVEINNKLADSPDDLPFRTTPV